MSAIQSITDEALINAIDQAHSRLVYVSPGVWPPVANAISRAWERLDGNAISVILDVDPEVCRLGFGSLNGLKTLQAAAERADQPIGHEKGVRICVLIADQQTFVFSPTPQLIESAPGSPEGLEASKPRANGIVLNTPPQTVEDEVGFGITGAEGRTLGLDAIDNKRVEEVEADLKKNPEKKFDLARVVNVYNAALCFVELKVSGYRLSQHKASLPKDLVKVARKNKDLSGTIDSAMHFLNAEDELLTGEGTTEETISQKRQEVEDEFLRPIVHIGKVIERDKIPDFETKIEELNKLISEFAEKVETKLATRYRETANSLAEAILLEVIKDLPERWKRELGDEPDPEHVRFRIIDTLLKSFGDPEKRISRMKTSLVYKDVTYDMLKDSNFIAEVAEHFPELKHLNEYAAAREREKPYRDQPDQLL